MIKGIIFDVDGIIVDSEPLHFEAAKKALAEFKIDLTLEDYLKFGVSKGAKYLFEEMSKKHNLQIDMARAFSIKKETFKKLFEENIPIREGIIELITKLSQKYLLAIASSGVKESVNFILEKAGIKNYFNIIISAEDVYNLKPFPDIYQKCYKLLGLESRECLAIEDSETGLISAKAAGLKCIVIPCEFTKNQNFSSADLILDNLSEITEERINSLE